MTQSYQVSAFAAASPVFDRIYRASVCLGEDREMASALQELLGASVVDGSGQTVAVSSLAGDDKVLGRYTLPT